MTPDGRGLQERLARRLLRVVFDADEADEIVRDVAELTRERRGLARAASFWGLVATYPVVEGWERTRKWLHATGEGSGMGSSKQDLRFAWRGLRRQPGFALTSVVILGAGLGAVIAVHSVVKGVLLDPLPFDEPERIMTLWMHDAEGQRARMTPGNLRDVEALTDVFAGVAAFQRTEAGLSDPESGTTVMLRGAAVTPAYFEALGVPALRGRTFEEADAELDAESVVVLANHVWRQHFGEEAGIVGQYVDLGGTRSRVIGVVPSAPYPTVASVSGELPFVDGDQDFFELIRFGGNYWSLRRPHLLGAVARLRQGTTPETASAALDVLSARLRAEYEPNAGESIVISPLSEEVVGDVRFGLWTLLAAVTLVFGIAAVNVGSLFLLRAEDRRAETELRSALGAPAARIFRERLTEAVLVTLLAAGAGVWAAGWMVRAMRGLVPFQIPRLADAAVEPVAVGTAVALALLLATLLGLVPTWIEMRAPREGRTHRTTGTRRQGRAQAFLIAGQAGLAVVVLVGALLLTRSFAALNAKDPGFDSGDSWVLRLHGSGYDFGSVLESVRALPGVASAALTYDHPLERNWQDAFWLVGEADASADSAQQATIRPFGQGFFETAGIRLLDGRVPDRLEHDGERRLAVVNDAFRRAHLPGAELRPGQQVRLPNGDIRLGEGESVFEIVGVVADVRFLGPATDSEPAVYVPFEHFAVGGRALLVRPQPPGVDLLPELRRVILGSAAGVAIDEAGTLDSLWSEALARPRFNMMLLALLGAVALLLCTLGAYGVVARTVTTRRREIGVRAALGAAGPAIAGNVVGRALRPLGLGALAGLVVSLWVSQLLRALLYELSPADPVSLVGGPLVLLLVGATGALVPSLRALSVDPSEALRAE